MSECPTPIDGQVCIVRLKGGREEYAVWTTGYSIYGAGGHFQCGNGGMLGIPVDVEDWFPTHWIATRTEAAAERGKQIADCRALISRARAKEQKS